MDAIGIAESVIVTTTTLYGRGHRANKYPMQSIEAHLDRLNGVRLLDFFGDDTGPRVTSPSHRPSTDAWRPNARLLAYERSH